MRVYCPATHAASVGAFLMLRTSPCKTVACSFDGLGHLGPLEDPATVAARVVQCFAASKDEKTWAALLPSQTIPTQHQAKL